MNTPRWARILAALALLVFLLAGGLWIEYPGLQYDEALFVHATYSDPSRAGVWHTGVLGDSGLRADHALFGGAQGLALQGGAGGCPGFGGVGAHPCSFVGRGDVVADVLFLPAARSAGGSLWRQLGSPRVTLSLSSPLVWTGARW